MSRLSNKQWKALSSQEQQAIIQARGKKQKNPRGKKQRSVQGGPAPRSRGGDSRVSKPVEAQIMASGVSNAINQIITPSSTAMFGVGFAYVCAALQRGWLANAGASDYPFAAWQYICGVFVNFMNGTVQQATQLPYWMWAFGRAISPKSVTKKQGEIYYKALASSGASPSNPSYSVGPVAYGYEANLYIPGLTATDMFPDATAPSTPTVQEQAFLSLCGFMKNDQWPASILCDGNCKTVLDKDVTAFCTILDVTGYGDQTNGGLAFLAALEVPIRTPLISTLLPQSNNGLTGSPTRFSNRATQFSGDALFATTVCTMLLPPSVWRTKKAPKLKAIDFLEFGDVVAIWASKVVSQYWKDPANAVSISEGVSQVPSTTVCPITLQEMLLCLRNEVMFAFGVTQTGVMSIQTAVATGSSDSQFMPFLTGTTGVAVQTMGMKLPQPLVENLRSLLLHLVIGRNKKDPELLYPMIGQYQDDTLVTGDYQFVSFDDAGAEVKTNTFTATPPVLQRKRAGSKGEVVWEKLLVETPINLVDTSNGTNYVFINDPTRLKTLVGLWNGWIEAFAAYSSPLTPLSTDPGVNVLTSINQTRYWSDVIGNGLGNTRAKDSVDQRVRANRAISATPYAARQILAVSYREKPFQATASITSNWILPTIKTQVGGGSPNATSFVKIESCYEEEISQVMSTTGDSGMLLSTVHDDFASQMVHAKGVQSVLDEELLTLSKEGRAGILSSLVANFVGSTFGSTAGSIAKGISDILPI